MKKGWISLLAVLLSAAVLCTTASGAITADTSGFYAVSGAASLELFTATGESVNGISTDGEQTLFYPDARRFSVTCEGAQNGESYIIFVLAGSDELTAENLVYINRQRADGETVCFANVYPTDLFSEILYRVYVSGPGISMAEPVATFCYYRVPCYSLKVVIPSRRANAAEAFRNDKTVGVGLLWPEMRCGKLTVVAEGMITWEQNVNVKDGEEKIVTLAERGDVDGNGAPLNVVDMECLYEYLTANQRGGALQSDPAYFLAVADANANGKVNILDYQYLYEQICSAG